MKTHLIFLIMSGLLVLTFSSANAQGRARKGAVQITPYKTTLIANGKDEVSIRVVAIDAAGNEIKDANNMIRFSLLGDAKITKIDPDNNADADKKTGDTSAQAHLNKGILWVTITSGTTIGH